MKSKPTSQRGARPVVKAPAMQQNVPAGPFDVPGYSSLASVLIRAYDQAAKGKGKERHAVSRPFDEQPMQHLIALNGLGFATGQAGKKAQEALRMEPEKAVHELLGAINYLAGTIIAIEKGAQ